MRAYRVLAALWLHPGVNSCFFLGSSILPGRPKSWWVPAVCFLCWSWLYMFFIPNSSNVYWTPTVCRPMLSVGGGTETTQLQFLSHGCSEPSGRAEQKSTEQQLHKAERVTGDIHISSGEARWKVECFMVWVLLKCLSCSSRNQFPLPISETQAPGLRVKVPYQATQHGVKAWQCLRGSLNRELCRLSATGHAPKIFQEPKAGIQCTRFIMLSLFSCSVVSNFLWPHGQQHALPGVCSTHGVCSNSCLLSQWCHPTISSSVVLVFSRLQSFPASGSFPMSQFFASGGQSIGVSASTSVLPMKIQNWFPLGWTGWISLQSKGLQHHSSKESILWRSAAL